MHFCHLNIRSIFTNFDLFSDFVSSGDAFDVLGLSETWLDSAVDDLALSIDGFKLIRRDRGTRGGGVGFYVNNSYKFKVLELYGPPTSLLEHLWISLKISGKKVCLGTLYRPPNTNLEACLEELESYITSYLTEYDYVIFGGDFNVDLLNPNSSNSKQIISFLSKYNLNQIISSPTRVTNNASTLIDYIVTSNNDIILEVDVANMEDISDHALVSCKFNIKKEVRKAKMVTYRDYRSFNYENFLNDLNSIKWDNIFDIVDVNDMLQFWNHNINELFDLHAPYKTVRVTKPPAPWLTENLKLLMRIRDKAYLKYKKCKTNQLWSEYKDIRNLVNRSVKLEKKAYFNHTLKTNPRYFWQSLRRLNISNSKRQVTSDLTNVDGVNDFFINQATQLTANLNTNPDILKKYENSKHPNIDEEFVFGEVSTEEIDRIVRHLKSNAIGSDNINLKMLNLVFPHLTIYFTYIINKCLINGIFPEVWKRANVLPIPKNDNPTELSQFRPISILPTLSKVLERIVADQLNKYLISKSLLPSIQSGFRANHSTTTALAHIADDIFRANDRKCNTCLILLDFSKAFDTLNHQTLCKKLKYFGISGSALLFFQNYLSRRYQRIVNNGLFSSFKSVNAGVPQGSILGPLLFSIYTSDFSNFLQTCNVHQYADDTQIYLSFDFIEIGTAVNNINFDLNTITDVSRAHSLVLNETKTELLVFGTQNILIENHPLFNITLNGQKLTPKQECKNLGIYFDVQLRFTNHVNYLIKKSYGKLKSFYMHKDVLDPGVKLKLCDSLILSTLSYCDVLYWPALTKRDRLSLQKIQNSCIRYCYSLRKFDHISAKIAESGWLLLQERFLLHLSCLTFKINLHQEPTYLYNKLVRGSNMHSRNTRHCNLYTVPKHRTSQFQKSFSYNATKVYNKLPPDIKICSSVVSFRKNVKKYLLLQRP